MQPDQPDDNIIGASLEENIADIKPVLDGFGPDKIVEVLNPLSQDFRVKFSRSVSSTPMPTDHERRMAELGVPVQHTGSPQAHVGQFVVLPSGKTMKLPGDIAQVAVRQLVNEILQRRGKRSSLADAKSRQDVETEVIYNHTTLIQTVNETPEESLNRTLNELNDPAPAVEENNEPAFPDVSPDTPDPAPGTGVSYEPKAAPKAK